jgi:hypothetical protein
MESVEINLLRKTTSIARAIALLNYLKLKGLEFPQGLGQKGSLAQEPGDFFLINRVAGELDLETLGWIKGIIISAYLRWK